MEFRTKLDYSSNRQIKQNPETFTVLSGATGFGIPFSALTTGPDPNYSGITSTSIDVVSTFSGNSGTTVFTWFDNGMQTGITRLSAITPTNSATTQHTGNVFSASSTTIIDGNTVALAYSGVSFDILPIGMYELGGGNYSGTVYTSRYYQLSANTLDFTGRTIWVDVSGITRTDSLIVLNDATFMNIGSLPSTGSLHYTSGGTLTVNTSDKRLKTNIAPITNALSKILALDGVYYNWTENPDGDKRIGFIAQDVEKVVPELVFKNERTSEKYLGVHYENVTPLLVEAIKELMSGGSTIHLSKTDLKTQTIIAEDNNIELNFNGNHETSIGGGITVVNAISDSIGAEIKTDKNGNWVTNNDFIPKSLTLPTYTPKSSKDKNGTIGNVTIDSDYIYIKVGVDSWKRIKLEEF
jgi:hypothetical protein